MGIRLNFNKWYISKPRNGLRKKNCDEILLLVPTICVLLLPTAGSN